MTIYVAFNNCYYGEIVALGLSTSKETLEKEYEYMKENLLIKKYKVNAEDTSYIDFPN